LESSIIMDMIAKLEFSTISQIIKLEGYSYFQVFMQNIEPRAFNYLIEKLNADDFVFLVCNFSPLQLHMLTDILTPLGIISSEDFVFLVCNFTALQLHMLSEALTASDIISLLTRMEPNTIMMLLHHFGVDNMKILATLHPLDVKIMLENIGEKNFFKLFEVFTSDQIIRLIKELGAANFVKLFEAISPYQMEVLSKNLEHLQPLKDILDQF